MRKTIVFLDRNAVDSVKTAVSGSIVKADRLQKLKALDKRTNFISPYLSIAEGQSGRRESKKEIEECILKEAIAVGKFFKYASTDVDFFKNQNELFSDTYSNSRETLWDNYTYFIMDSYVHIFEPVAPSKQIEIENKIFELARKYGVDIRHPLHIVVLAVLYGNKAARDVVKPKQKYQTEENKQKAAYNTLSDIMIIPRIGKVMSLIGKNDTSFKSVKYFTFDKGLSLLLNAIKINSAFSSNDGTAIRISIPRSLFRTMNDEDFCRLKTKLGCIE